MEPTRRHFFRTLGHALSNLIPVSEKRNSDSSSNGSNNLKYLRPPGAIDDPEFLQKCTRCNDCLMACPRQSIRHLGHEFGDESRLPAIIPKDSPCYLCDDMPCTAACTTGALKKINRQDAKMGTAVIDFSRCYQANNQPCDYCIDRCPLRGQAIKSDKNDMPLINSDACTGCGVCVYLCPAEAVTIFKVKSGK